MQDDEAINSPAHYRLGTLEVKDVINEAGDGLGFWRGAALKYLLRYDKRGRPVEDLRKAQRCIEYLVELVQSEEK